MSISIDRLRVLLKGCVNPWHRPWTEQFGEAPRRGLAITWKCNPDSSAWGDMEAFFGVKDEAVEFIGIRPILDYTPPAG